MSLKLKKIFIIIIVSLVILLLDQASKQIILEFLNSNKIHVYKINYFLNFIVSQFVSAFSFRFSVPSCCHNSKVFVPQAL